jgi:hypothetical protein
VKTTTKATADPSTPLRKTDSTVEVSGLPPFPDETVKGWGTHFSGVAEGVPPAPRYFAPCVGGGFSLVGGTMPFNRR